MRFFQILSLLALLSLTACGDATSTSGQAGTAVAGELTANTETGYTSSGASCLGEEGRSLCDFFDKDLLATYIPDAELSGYKDTERKMVSGCGCSTDHPTKTYELKVANSTMRLPSSYIISISGVNSYDNAEKARSRFEGEFKSLTPEEIARTREELEVGIQGRVDRGEMTQEAGDLAKSFGGVVGKSTWKKVTGIGDLAVWGNALPDREPPTMGTLAVLDGDTKFLLNVDLLESKEASKAAAIEMAKAIIASCD